VQCNFQRPLPTEIEPTLSILELRALRKLVCIDPVQGSDVVPHLALLAGLPELEELHVCLVLMCEVSATRKRRTYSDSQHHRHCLGNGRIAPGLQLQETM